MILAGFAALIPVGYIAYLALSKKTSLGLKRVAIGALVLVVLTFFLCAILLLVSGTPVGTQKSGYTDLPPVPAAEEKDNTPILIALAIVLLFLIMVIIVAIREQQRLEKTKQAGKHKEKVTASKGENDGQHNRKN